MHFLSLAFLALAPLVQSTSPATASATPSPTPPAFCPLPGVTLPAHLDRVLRDYENAWSKGDEKALAHLFAEDGFVMAMGGFPVQGRAEIERHYGSSGGGPLLLRAISFFTEGSTGFILGCYAAAPAGPEIGKFTLTLKKDKAGRWLIFSDMDNPNRRR